MNSQLKICINFDLISFLADSEMTRGKLKCVGIKIVSNDTMTLFLLYISSITSATLHCFALLRSRNIERTFLCGRSQCNCMDPWLFC